MNNIEKIRRVVCCHQWDNLAEWVDSIHTLADFRDEELIAALPKQATLARTQTRPAHRLRHTQ